MALSKVQEASSSWSICWKQESEKLLNGAVDSSEFKDAVIWCGKGGNVMRTVPSQYVAAYADFLYKHKSEIMSGKFSLSSLPAYGGKRPFSWASKVCHIMNPQGYPLIYDENIRKAYSGGLIKDITDYENILLGERTKWAGKSNDDIYKNDSDLWASVL